MREVTVMQNGTFKSFIMWLLVASPIWWTCGCYTAREVTKVNEVEGSEIEVTTKGDNVYIFKTWKSDGCGGISGQAKWLDPPSGGLWAEYVEGKTSLPLDSIKIVVARDPNVGLSVITALGVGVALVGVALITFMLTPWSASRGPW